MRELTRRDVLAGATALGAVAVAGCVADDDEPESEDGDAGDELDLVSVELTPVEPDEDAETGREVVEAAVENGDLVISGQFTLPTPQHEAVLVEDSFDDGALSLVVDAEDTSDEDTAGPQVTVPGEYEIVATFNPVLSDVSDLRTVTVEHDTADGGTHTVVEDGEAVASTKGLGGETVESDEEEDRTTEDRADVDPVADYSIETLGENGEAGFDVEWHDDSVVVTGGIEVNWRGRYEAAVEEIGVQDGVLSVSVGTEDTTDDDEVTQPTVGVLEYELVVNLANSAAVEDVDVRHAGDRPGASIDG